MSDKYNDVNVFLFAGLPGCGKTAAAETAKDAIEKRKTVSYHEISDYVRESYRGEPDHDEYGGLEPDDNDLGEWAAEKKTTYGDGYFARILADELTQGCLVEAENIIVSGIRSPEEVDAFRDRFDNVIVLPIWTLPDERYKRLEEREGEYTHEEFNARKQRELWQWGCIDLFSDEEYYDHIIPNNFSEDKFEAEVRYIVETYVHGNVPRIYEEPPFPEGLSKQHIAQYL